MKYRPEIDGLRALAVVPVILFHAGFELFDGGFVGVDVFFVISGFLITSIIAKDLELRRFDIFSFYERRARRILPALFIYLLVAMVLGYWLFPPHAAKNLGESIFSVCTFASNIFFYIETDYFNNLSELAPLLHTWSLSVEEQFYFFFPFLLLLLSKASRGVGVCFLIAILLVSLTVSEIFIDSDKPFSFYMIFTRFWELGAGGLLALMLPQHKKLFSYYFAECLSTLGVSFILFSILFFDKETHFPGLNATIPVSGTLLVIAFGDQPTFVRKILSLPLMVGIGLISYSWYLAHHVLFSICRNVGVALDNTYEKNLAISASLLLAITTYYVIEKPVRQARLSKRMVFSLSLMGLLFFASLGLVGHLTNGFKELKFSYLPEEARKSVIDSDAELKNRRPVWAELLKKSGIPFEDNQTKKNILILGDSKAQDLFVSLCLCECKQYYEIRHLYLDDPCMDSPGSRQNKKCQKQLERVVESGLIEKADHVILTATWPLTTNANVIRFIEYLTLLHKKISLVSTCNFSDVASLSYVIASRGMNDKEASRYLFDNLRLDWRRQFLLLKEKIITRGLQVNFLEKRDAFCNCREQSCNLKGKEGWFFYDSGHLTLVGAKYFGQYVLTHGWL